jgi:hypothetical protein
VDGQLFPNVLKTLSQEGLRQPVLLLRELMLQRNLLQRVMLQQLLLRNDALSFSTFRKSPHVVKPALTMTVRTVGKG